MVSALEERMCELLKKSEGILEEVGELRKDKAALEVKFLSRLEEEKKALDDISRLHERVTSDQS